MAEAPFHFYRIIRPFTLQDKKLEIPSKFVKRFGNELSTVATLTVPNGSVWKVELTKNGRKFWFQTGWHVFVEYHSISAGHFLLFRYLKNSNFHVLIFNTSACEIRYPHYLSGLENDTQELVLHQADLESDDNSVEITGCLTPKPPAADSALEINSWEKSTGPFRSSKFKRDNETRSKRCRMEELVDNVGEDSSDEANKRTKFDEHDALANLEEMGISVNTNFKNIAAKEKERAITAARLFSPKNPSFMVILQPRNIRKELYLPSKFVKYLIQRESELIKLQDCDEREWSVKLNCKPSTYGAEIICGWMNFAKDKNLKEGDICIFELIKEKNIVLKVFIYR